MLPAAKLVERQLCPKTREHGHKSRGSYERRNLSRYGQGAPSVRSGRRDIPTGGDNTHGGGDAPRKSD